MNLSRDQDETEPYTAQVHVFLLGRPLLDPPRVAGGPPGDYEGPT
jgi:hypothetical protein